MRLFYAAETIVNVDVGDRQWFRHSLTSATEEEFAARYEEEKQSHLKARSRSNKQWQFLICCSSPPFFGGSHAFLRGSFGKVPRSLLDSRDRVK